MNWKHPKNDGLTNVDYNFGLQDIDKNNLSELLNTAAHVYRMHADGNWKTVYKDDYARQLLTFFEKLPELSSRLIRSEDRVIKMLTYRALELNKTDHTME